MSETRIDKEKNGFLKRKEKEEKCTVENDEKLCREKLKAFYDDCNCDEGIKNNIIGQRIRHVRECFNIPKTTLAEKSYIHRSTINDIEKGNYKELSHFETIFNLVSALDVDIDMFIADSQDQELWYRKFSAYLPSDELENSKIEYDIEELKIKIFNLLEADIIYQKDKNEKKIPIPKKYIELLQTNIFNSFETIYYLLKK